MDFNKLKLREGLMGRMDRKYCEGNNVKVVEKLPSEIKLKSFSVNLNKEKEVKESPKKRFSFGKR